jgi:hypothetical protein
MGISTLYDDLSVRWVARAIALALCGNLASNSYAEVFHVKDPGGFRSAVSNAKPGDSISLAAGEYHGGFYFRDLHGTSDAPITIAAADSQHPPKFFHDADPLHFSQCSNLVIQNLSVARAGGNGMNIDDGGKRDQASHHIRLVGISVIDVGPEGNRDGIKMSGVDDFQIEDCTIQRWGSGGSGIDMVGCHRGQIANCIFKDGGSSGVQTKGASADITIRKCRFENAGERAVNIGGSTGDDFFRPALETIPSGERYEARDITVEGCVFIGGVSPIVFVGVDGASVRFNTIYRPERYPVRILREKSEPGFLLTRDGHFENNIVIAPASNWPGNLINVGVGTAPETFTFARNLWYCDQSSDRRAPKLPVVEQESMAGVDPMFIDAKNGNLDVSPDSPALDRGAHALQVESR